MSDRFGMHAETATAEARMGAAFARLFAGGIAGKALGLVRELALAATFGTGAAAGAFRAAQTATVVPTHMFTSDTLHAGFIPLCARYLREDPARARALFWSVLALLGAIGTVVAVLLFAAAPAIAALLVPGFDADRRALTAAMMRIMAAGVPFYVLASLGVCVEMAQRRYLLASIRASVQNAGIIAGVIAAALTGNPLLLGWGFTAWCVLLAILSLHSLARAGMLALPRGIDWTQARSVLRDFAMLIAPLLLLPVLQQGAHVVERIIASLIDPRAVPALDYARAIAETGIALIAVPLGMAGLAELGRLDAERARRQLQRMLAPLLMVTVPVSLFLALHAQGIVRLVFARGDFGEPSTAVTSLILTGLAIGFWAHVCAIVLVRSLSAHGRNREVAIIMALASAVHVLVNIIAWRFIGALSLGLAASTFALVLFALATRAVGVGRAALRTLAPLAVGAVLYLPLGWHLRDDDIAALLVAFATFLAFWALFLAGWWWLRSLKDRPLRTPAFGRTP